MKTIIFLLDSGFYRILVFNSSLYLKFGTCAPWCLKPSLLISTKTIRVFPDGHEILLQWIVTTLVGFVRSLKKSDTSGEKRHTCPTTANRNSPERMLNGIIILLKLMRNAIRHATNSGALHITQRIFIRTTWTSCQLNVRARAVKNSCNEIKI